MTVKPSALNCSKDMPPTTITGLPPLPLATGTPIARPLGAVRPAAASLGSSGRLRYRLRDAAGPGPPVRGKSQRRFGRAK